jgi:hypothetical protein
LFSHPPHEVVRGEHAIAVGVDLPPGVLDQLEARAGHGRAQLGQELLVVNLVGVAVDGWQWYSGSGTVAVAVAK